MYNYFISYQIEGGGTGNNNIELSGKITSMSDIRAIEKALCRNGGFINIVITNYILL